MNIYIDFESRSTVSIKSVDTWNYSKHPTTEILCVVFAIGDCKPIRILNEELYTNTSENVKELKALAANPKNLFYAHNSKFEVSMWLNNLVYYLDYPEIPIERWRCTQAKCAAYAIPKSLEDACIYMELSDQKDKEGSTLMKKMCKPRKVLPDGTVIWWESDEMINRLADYCEKDVIATRALDKAVPDLTVHELKFWIQDQTINLRGIRIDLELVDSVIAHYEEYIQELNAELFEMSGIARGSLTQQIKDHISECYSVDLPDLTEGTVSEYLSRDYIDPSVKRILRIRAITAMSSIKKYYAANNYVDASDGRLRWYLSYCNAGTGRWSSSGVQLQNLFRGDFSDISNKLGVDKKSVDCMVGLKQDIKSLTLEELKDKYTDVINALCSALRGIVIPDDGYELCVADFSSVETVFGFWMTGEDEGLELIRNRVDPYVEIAKKIFNDPTLTKENAGVKRDLGKQVILGGIYQLSGKGLFNLCSSYGIDVSQEECALAIKTLRKTYKKLASYWFQLEKVFKDACYSGEFISCGKVTFHREGKALRCILPSGRSIYFQSPSFEVKEYSSEEIAEISKSGSTRKLGKATLSYWSYKDGVFKQVPTHGGKLFENIIQAVARDAEACAISNLMTYNSGKTYQVLTHSHDEPVCQKPIGTGSVEDMCKLMCNGFNWIGNAPLRSEGWIGPVYMKK